MDEFLGAINSGCRKNAVKSTLPETNIFAAENGWLEYEFVFFLGFWPIFRGELSSFREGSQIVMGVSCVCVFVVFS